MSARSVNLHTYFILKHVWFSEELSRAPTQCWIAQTTNLLLLVQFTWVPNVSIYVVYALIIVVVIASGRLSLASTCSVVLIEREPSRESTESKATIQSMGDWVLGADLGSSYIVMSCSLKRCVWCSLLRWSKVGKVTMAMRLFF